MALLETTSERWWLGQAHWILGLNLSYRGRFEQGLDALGLERFAARARALRASPAP
ncbi:MAG: hypothetical protein HYV94_17530 [Candidatus Rokubacteria bacterium]|nr:hypothetical protein [Candidatus Rokubacteria bacterium]